VGERMRQGCVKARRLIPVLLVILLVACSDQASPASISAPTPTGSLTPSFEPTTTQAPLTPEPSATPALPLSPTATATTLPAATAPSLSDTWFGAGTVGLFVASEDGPSSLWALQESGTLASLLDGVGSDARVSPDGKWLGYTEWSDDGSSALVLHHATSDETRQILSETTSGLSSFTFFPDGERLVYLDLGATTTGGVPWALVATDLDSGTQVRYEALMADAESRPLPGGPAGWIHGRDGSEELIIETFLPYTEAGWMGVWGVMLPADGAPASLAALPLRELVSATPPYYSRMYVSPDREKLAFLARDPDYYPQGYASVAYDIAVNRLEMLRVEDGTRHALLVVDNGSALAPTLSWSPDGERLLFAQGTYEGENFDALSLKSSDAGGSVVTYGPLDLPPLGGLLELVWCKPALALYVTWDGRDSTEHLLSFDLNTGVSTEVSAARRISIVGCAP
jgi:hypothetical protein